MQSLDRHTAFDVAIRIAPRTYRRTYTSDIAYAFRFDEGVRAQLRRLAERQIAENTNATLDAVTAEPGYIRARVGADSYEGTSPKAVRSALQQVAPEWNERHGTVGADGTILDGVHFGDSMVALVAPEGAPTPAEWADEHAPDSSDLPESVPDESPLLTVEGDSRRDPSPLEDRDRDIAVTVVVPIDPATYEGREKGRYDTSETAFDWRDEDRERFREEVSGRFCLGKDYRVELHPTHISATVRTGSFRGPPTQSPLRELSHVVTAFNRRRPDRAESETTTLLRPELEIGDRVYGGANPDTGDVVGEWIDAVGADEETGEPFDPEPEPEPEPDAPDSDRRFPITDTVSDLLRGNSS